MSGNDPDNRMMMTMEGEEEEVILGLRQNVPTSPTTRRKNQSVFYQAKCGAFTDLQRNSLKFQIADLATSDEEEEEMGEEMNKINIPESLKNVPLASLNCTCCDPNCKLRKYFRYMSRQQAYMSDDLSTEEDLYQRLHRECPELEMARSAIVRRASRFESVPEVYNSCRNLSQDKSDIFSDRASDKRDTVLMQLCERIVKRQDCQPEKGYEKKQCLLLAQILAFIRLFIEHQPDLLFVRSKDGMTALANAGLSNKKEVAVYLVLLYKLLGRDPNEASSEGHTILHMMARKGDDCFETLEALMNLREPNTRQRLLRLDIVNTGRKTPLDVSLACAEIFSTGKHRVVYNQVIQLFHDVIIEDANELENEATAHASSTNNYSSSSTNTGMTFRNF